MFDNILAMFRVRHLPLGGLMVTALRKSCSSLCQSRLRCTVRRPKVTSSRPRQNSSNSLWAEPFRRCHSLPKPRPRSRQKPTLGRYSRRSASTKPTWKNKLQAGRNGSTKKLMQMTSTGSDADIALPGKRQQADELVPIIEALDCCGDRCCFS